MKKILLFFTSILLLTSCTSIKQINYTTNSTVLDKSNQELYLKLLNDIKLKYVYLTNVTDFDEYMQHLNTLSGISYSFIKDSKELTEETIEIEIDLQEKIINTLKSLSLPRELFSSEEAHESAKDFVSEYMTKLIQARLSYLRLKANNIEEPSIADKSNMSLIDLATIPNLDAVGYELRAKYLR